MDARHLSELAAVAAGGALGASARWLAGKWLAPTQPFPWGTLTVNLTGCMIMGVLVGSGFQTRPGALRVFACTGFLGAFTTMSAFSAESVELFESGRRAAGAVYVSVSLLGSLAALAAGLILGRWLFPVSSTVAGDGGG